MLPSPGGRNPWHFRRLAMWFVGGLFLGGLATGLILSIISGLVSPVPIILRKLAAGVVIGLAVTHEFGSTLLLPQNGRQVRQTILRDDRRQGLLQFGFELGTGVRTFVTSGAPYIAAAVALLLAGDWWHPAAAGVAFALGRVSMTLTRAGAPSIPAWDRRLNTVLGHFTRISTVAAALAALGIIVQY